MKEGFLTNLGTAELFFRVCRRYGIEGADRLALMRQLVRRKQVKYLRDVDAFTKGKRVAVVRPKESPTNAD